MTVKEYNGKYITLIGECCALDGIGFISVEKDKLPIQACSYIECLEQEVKKQQEVIDKLELENKVLKEQMVAMVKPNYTYGIR